jgi:hypothetical protein
MTETPAPRPTVLLVFHRDTITDQKKPAQVWRALPENRQEWPTTAQGLYDLDERVYTMKVMPKASPGAIYQFEYDPQKPSSIYPTTQRYSGRYEEKVEGAKETIVSWQVENTAVKRAEEAKKLAKTEGTLDLLDEQLEPIRQAWMRMNPKGQAALVGLMIQRVTRWRRDK